MLKDIVLVSTSRKGMAGGIFFRLSATGTINKGQTSVMKEVVGKDQSISRKEEIKRNENCAEKYFS